MTDRRAVSGSGCVVAFVISVLAWIIIGMSLYLGIIYVRIEPLKSQGLARKVVSGGFGMK